MIHTGVEESLKLSIDGHTLQVVASDGIDFKTKVNKVDGIYLTPGERYDFILQPTNSPPESSHTIRLSRKTQDGVSCNFSFFFLFSFICFTGMTNVFHII